MDQRETICTANTDTSWVTEMSESAADRKARLAALRAAANEAGVTEGAARAGSGEPTIRLRNYIPQTTELQEFKMLAPVVAAPDADPEPEPELEPVPDFAGEGEVDLKEALGVKKANWDLRRDVSKKLEKLERRTTRAMVEILRNEEAKRLQMAEGE
mmetsp:Transcript_317/g.989  ORF Transcript_317/g.989 Transcript_317/m.989 type:complete len:157 (+) Transcript_317:1109-1579(+)